MENQNNTTQLAPQSRKLPFWLMGFIVCFIIFIVSTLYVGIKLENLVKNSLNPNGFAGTSDGLVLLGVYFILLPIIFIFSSIISFVQRKNTTQFKTQYMIIIIVLILTGFGFLYSLRYLFPVSNHQNVEACSLIKDPRYAGYCYEENAIKERDPSICDKIDEAAFGFQSSFRNYCYNEAKRGRRGD